MRIRTVNAQACLECLCCCGFGVLLLYAVLSEQYLSYVTPRMKPYLYFAIAVMGLFALAGATRLFRPQYKARALHCLVLVLPALLLVLPHSALGTSDVTGSFMGGNVFLGPGEQNAYATPQALPSSPAAAPEQSELPNLPDSAVRSQNAALEVPAPDAAQAATIDAPTLGAQAVPAALPGLDAANRKITVPEDSFGQWVSELYMNMEKYAGYTISMTGFVLKDPELFEENEFVPARLMMTCCAADLVPAGLLCKYDKAPALTAGAWVTVEGTLFVGQYEQAGVVYTDPQIQVQSVTPAEEIAGYVYPY